LFQSQREAKAYLDMVKPEVRDGTHTPERQSITVADAAALWIDRVETVLKRHSSTVTQYRNHIDHITRAIGAVKLSALNGPKIEEFQDGLLRDGSRAMTQKIMVSLKAILANAKRTGKVAVNHAAGARLPPPGSGDRRPKPKIGETIPTKDELKAILAEVDGSRWHPLLLTAGLAGLRSSELRALRWVNVDLEDTDCASIHVVERADEKNEFDAPKSDAGTREIPIQSLLAKTLQRWRDVCPKGKRGLVFPTGIGTVESHANIANRGWYAPQRKVGIVKQKEDEDGRSVFDQDGKPVMVAKYGFHALRHFAASFWIEQGHLPKRVQELMGHASIVMTLDLYAGLFPAGADEREKMEKATAFLTPVKAA
jgi:integrase